MAGEFRHDLEPAVERAEAEILQIVHELVPEATLKRFGPIDIRGPVWLCWVVTPTDEARDMLAANGFLRPRLLTAATLATGGLPPKELHFQSQETVDRDYKGQWLYAMR